MRQGTLKKLQTKAEVAAAHGAAAEAGNAALGVIQLGTEHVSNILTALPKETKDGEMYLLLGDPDIPGLHHCAVVIVVEERGPGGVKILGAKRNAVKVDPMIDVLGFTIRDLVMRLEGAEAAPTPQSAVDAN